MVVTDYPPSPSKHIRVNLRLFSRILFLAYPPSIFKIYRKYSLFLLISIQEIRLPPSSIKAHWVNLECPEIIQPFLRRIRNRRPRASPSHKQQKSQSLHHHFLYPVLIINSIQTFAISLTSSITSKAVYCTFPLTDQFRHLLFIPYFAVISSNASFIKFFTPAIAVISSPYIHPTDTQ